MNLIFFSIYKYTGGQAPYRFQKCEDFLMDALKPPEKIFFFSNLPHLSKISFHPDSWSYFVKQSFII